MNKYNKEGYLDLTPYLALNNHYYPIVYICSPYAGDIDKNVINAKEYSRFAILSGCLPITPHLLFPQMLDDNNLNERHLGLQFGNILMDKCSEIWVFGDCISSGMKAEIKRAIKKNYIIRYFDTKCKEI